MKQTECYIKGYPRPQFVREEWISLDGKWDFIFDKENKGEVNGYFKGFKKQYDILVPFSYETEASGIAKKEQCDFVWYQKKLNLSKEQLEERILINFDGVDYIAKVWVNGTYIGSHRGGYARFTLDITNSVIEGENLIVVKAEDYYDITQPRGKQRWMPYNYGCWYVQTTGIWKSVWLEFCDKAAHIQSAKITPCVDMYSFEIEFETAIYMRGNYEIVVQTRFEGKDINSASVTIDSDTVRIKIYIESSKIDNQVAFWHPNGPCIYDFVFTLKKDGEPIDVIKSYCGLRDFRAEGNTLKLNGYPFYSRMVLYQGYWEKSDLTPPDEESIIKDIQLIKDIGFNAIRIHNTVETDLFLYYADIMGLLVWCEMPSPHTFNEKGKERFVAEWQEIVKQAYNHSSVAVWVIYNESWGIREVAYNKAQQTFTEGMYYITKSYDLMRPVISNDGWEHTRSDIISLHNYEQDTEEFKKMYSDFGKLQDNNPKLPQRSPFARGYSYAGQPVLMTEYGGCAFCKDAKDGWGYGNGVNSKEEFYNRYEGWLNAIYSFEYCAGYCYTQFTDVQQEVNGLFTIDRKCKVDIEKIRALNERK